MSQPIQPPQNSSVKWAIPLWRYFVLFPLLGLLILVYVLSHFIPKTVEDPNYNVNATIAEIGNLRTELETFKDDCGRYPTTAEGLNVLVNCPPGLEKVWHRQTDEIPQDYWGNLFRYRFPGVRDPSSFDLDSAGPDGIFDTADDLGATNR